MNVGKWIGKFVGQWFGAVEELPPGFTSGTAHIQIGATGSVYGGTIPAFISGTASISLNASGTLERIEEPGGAGMVRRHLRWKAEQARLRAIELKQAEEEAARIAIERIAEARRQAELAEKQAQELIARLSIVPTVKDSLSVAANDNAANPDAATDSAPRKISVSFSSLNELIERNSESVPALTEQISSNAFYDDDALALIMILAEID